jgi:diguanylate cyclase (GGDEF)-like protein
MENLPALLSALAYGAMALALARVFMGRSAASLGLARWPVLAGVLAQAVLQALLSCSAGAAARVAGMGACIGLLCLAGSMFPLMHGVHQRLARSLSKRGQARLAESEAQAADAQAWLEMAAQTANFGRWRINLPERTVEWSDEVYDIHGLSPGEFLPEFDEVIALFHPDDRALAAASLDMAMIKGGSFEARLRIRRPDGALRHVILRGRTQGASTILGLVVDITEQKQAEARMREANQVALQANAALRDMSTEDELTGLANRRQFDLSLVAEFKRALRSNMPLGLVLIDLDQFQTYNEQYGKAAGDACLRRVAQAIASIPRRTGDLVARHAGEEIAVLLPLANDDGTVRVASVIHEAVRALRIPHLGTDSGLVTVSCGAAAFTSVQDLNNPLELARRADQALYRAKTEGRDRVARFEPGMGNDKASPYPAPPMTDMDRFIKSRN